MGFSKYHPYHIVSLEVLPGVAHYSEGRLLDCQQAGVLQDTSCMISGGCEVCCKEIANTDDPLFPI